MDDKVTRVEMDAMDPTDATGAMGTVDVMNMTEFRAV